jgi:hypothetical protein
MAKTALFYLLSKDRGGGGSRHGAGVKDITRKSLEFQQPSSSERLIKLDET